MSHRIPALLGIGLCGLLSLTACGSGGESNGSGSARTSESSSASEASIGVPAQTASPAVTEPPATVTEVDILTDFGDVCRGVTLPGATPYDPARAGVHPLITMAGEDPEYESAGANLPDQWDPVIGEEHSVELVACLGRTSSTLRQTCDGYLDDANNDTGNTVEMYDASYDVRLIAATTGKLTASTQMDATDDRCPTFVLFDADEPVKAQYAEPTDALTAWLAAYVET